MSSLSRSLQLEKYNSVKRWFTYVYMGRTSSESTRRTYLWALEKWCDFTKKNPDELIEQRRKDVNVMDPATQQKVIEQMVEAFNNLEKQGYARATCGTFWNSVKSFYKSNYAPIFAKSPPTWTTKIYKVPNQEDIRTMCERADPRLKLWILCQKDSGMSGGDLIRVDTETKSSAYGTVNDQLRSGQVPLHMTIMRGKYKPGGYHDSYFGEEAFEVVQEAPKERMFTLAYRTFGDYIPRLAKKAGIKGRITPHCFRRFFNTYAKLGITDYGATELLVEYWMGHSLGRTKAAYLIPPVEEQQKLYLSAYEKLRCLI